MVLGARNGVVEQPAQMLRAACCGMRPKHNNVWKLAVLDALDCHGEVAPMLPETQTRTVADGRAHELRDLNCGEVRLPVCPAQTVHVTDGLRDGGVSGQRRLAAPGCRGP